MIFGFDQGIQVRLHVPVLPCALYVVATPIGNLQDISPRALEVLRNVDLILAEDTRHSAHLLGHFGIDTPVRSFHEHNERKATADMISRLREGASLALISDAGTPVISDPGYPLICAAHANGCRVIPVPGPCALICALSVSGIATERFVFEGFLPARRAARTRRLQELAQEDRTQIFYEAPHRICRLIEDLVQSHGSQRTATLAKELTKVHETVYKGDLKTLYKWLAGDEQRLKGEFVLVVEGATAPVPEDHEIERVLDILLDHMSVRKAVTVAATILQEPRNKIYKLAIKRRPGLPDA
ncbi:MAG: 16S rRNA (cytidine(1402)-2'-O)-methyltransferase [Gammaproteobacteria bacterium]